MSGKDVTCHREGEEKRTQFLLFSYLSISCHGLLLSKAIEKPTDKGTWETVWRHRPWLRKGHGLRTNKQPAQAGCFLNFAIPRLSLFCINRWMLSWLATVFLVPVLVSPKFIILFHCHLATKLFHKELDFIFIFSFYFSHHKGILYFLCTWNSGITPDRSPNCPGIWGWLSNYRPKVFFTSG